MEGTDTGNKWLTLAYSIIALGTGWTGLNLDDINILLEIVLKLLSIISMTLIVVINWETAMTKIEKFLNKK